jgi:CRISPR-associated endonuclease/helicase Cas3
MNILLVSQCTKRALTETRRILDQFAERRGDRTWQTPITQQGLDTLRMLLRKTARKNTAVACHWIRGQNHSELLWVVGDGRQFNTNGATPTNMTERNILRQDDENEWHTAHDIRLLAAMAALFHDFGKANDTFDAKLRGKAKTADPYRHEWVSLRLFQAFVGQDSDAVWLQRLADGVASANPKWFATLEKDGVDKSTSAPLNRLPPLAQAIGWLIVSHHRLPVPVPPQLDQMNAVKLSKLWESLDAEWCGSRDKPNEDDDAKTKKDWERALQGCWTFKAKLPHHSATWRQRAATLAQRMLERSALFSVDQSWLKDNPYVMHMARLTLVLADHHFSSIEGDTKLRDPTYQAWANTDRNKAGNPLKQRLDEHLIGVEKTAHSVALQLPQLEASLPRIHNHRAFKQRSGNARFAWQDKSFDLATALQTPSEAQGFFGVNMASTGCGKTLANARIMYALAHPQRGARFTVALGLRTLTLQTGDALRQRMGLGADELAVMVGGSAVRALHEYQQQKTPEALPTTEHAGSESAADLLPANTHVQYENALPRGPLSDYLGGHDPKKQAAQKLLHAPVLVCTVDHLMPACEATRGGHHIMPMLRLLTSDLVLDEPDDFGMEDLYALTRLVHWAGLLGSRVLLSSATLPPALIQGLFAAYLVGRQSFQKNRGQPGLSASVCCAWFDENGVMHSPHGDEDSFAQSHTAFVQQRVAHLAAMHSTDCRRRAEVVPVPITATDVPQIRREYANLILQTLLRLHQDPQNHTVDSQDIGNEKASVKRVSFGLVRMANIDPLIDVALELHKLAVPQGTRIHLCVYHSRHPLVVRSGLERCIDDALQRHGQGTDPAAQLRKPSIRAAIEAHPEVDHVFVVLATAVAEVGRDHDYDWAVVEPSSMRSIIQLAGRVRRHRAGVVANTNIALLDRNLRSLEQPDNPAFTRPGFETKDFSLETHSLETLLREAEWEQLDATARITQAAQLHATQHLTDLEHARLGAMMQTLDPEALQGQELNVRRWWQTLSHFTAVEQRRKPFRYDPQGREEFVLLPTEEEDDFEFHSVDDEGRPQQPQVRRFELLPLSTHPAISPWAVRPYLSELSELAEAKDLPLFSAAWRFGALGLPKGQGDQVWAWHALLGYRRKPD